jgi:hypothetical protein
MAGSGVGNTAGEGITGRPESVAAGAEPERFHRLKLEAAEDAHLRVV